MESQHGLNLRVAHMTVMWNQKFSSLQQHQMLRQQSNLLDPLITILRWIVNRLKVQINLLQCSLQSSQTL